MITKAGWGVLAGTVLLLGAGWEFGYPELIALAIAGLVILLSAVAWMSARPSMRVMRRIEPSRVAEGEIAEGILTITNTGRRRSPPFQATELVGGKFTTVVLPSLRPGGSHVAAYRIPTASRGVHEIGSLTIGQRDPFGLLHAAHAYPSKATLRVVPRLHAVSPLPTGRSRDADGRTSAAAPRGGVAFHSLRQYEEGDDLRLIHWRSTARTGNLMVRDTVVPHEPRMMVLLDTSEAPYTDSSFEDAVRVAASLTVSAFDGGYPVEARTSAGRQVRAERGEGSRDLLLDLYAEARRAPNDPGLLALGGLRPPDDGVALGVVTGQPPGATLAVVRAIRRRFALVTVVLLGDGSRASRTELRGTFVVQATSSHEFATVWNRQVPR